MREDRQVGLLILGEIIRFLRDIFLLYPHYKSLNDSLRELDFELKGLNEIPSRCVYSPTLEVREDKPCQYGKI